MAEARPIVLSIAGFDPCAGAGLLADIKTFEQHKVYGLGIATAQTLQTEHQFFSIRWEDDSKLMKELEIMLQNYTVSVVKIGIVQNIKTLHTIVSAIHNFNNQTKIIVDPVIRSTTEFNFWDNEIDEEILIQTLSMITLLTPNQMEIKQLTGEADLQKAIESLRLNCTTLLKGGHSKETPGVDFLYTKNETHLLTPNYISVFPKHGSGCVLSASIASNLALGNDLLTACTNAKLYTEFFLLSNPTLLGYHAA